MLGIIKSVILTLNKIEVHGKENLDRLLGCMQVLDQLVGACEETTETKEERLHDHTDEQGDDAHGAVDR